MTTTVGYTACEKGCIRWDKRSKRCPKGAPAPKNNAELCNMFIRKGD